MNDPADKEEGKAARKRAQSKSGDRPPDKETKMAREGEQVNMEEQAKRAASSRELQQQFGEAYSEYLRKLMGALETQQTQQRTADAYNTYINSLREIWKPQEVQEQVSDAYRNYIKTMQDPGAPAQAQQRMADAYQQYVGALQRAWNPVDAQQQAVEGYRKYMQKIGEAIAPEDVQEKMREAYRSYIHSVQKLLSQQTPEALDTNTLLVVAQSLMAAASLTNTAMGALRQRWLSAAYLEAAAPSTPQKA